MKKNSSRLIFVVVTSVAAVACFAAGLTGSVPSTGVQSGPSGGTTGSIACQFTGTNTPATKWWVDYPTPEQYKYNVQVAPATPVTGFSATSHTVYFSTSVANVTAPPPKTVTVQASKTVKLYVEYK